MSSVPAAANARGRLSPVPDQSPDSWTGGSCVTTGVTTRDARAVNARLSSMKPNGSLSRTVSGPML